MARSAGSILTDKILARHGARSDLRLWRNETSGAWVGAVGGRTTKGGIILRPGARLIQAGLCIGSADLIGLRNDGVFLALEVKAPGDKLKKEQRVFLTVVKMLGGVAAVVTSVEDVDAILGEPPK